MRSAMTPSLGWDHTIADGLPWQRMRCQSDVTDCGDYLMHWGKLWPNCDL